MLGQAAAATMLVAGGWCRSGLPVGIEAALTLVALVALYERGQLPRQHERAWSAAGGDRAHRLRVDVVERGRTASPRPKLALAGAVSGSCLDYPRAASSSGRGSLFLG